VTLAMIFLEKNNDYVRDCGQKVYGSKRNPQGNVL
jgi:hypothetical protein